MRASRLVLLTPPSTAAKLQALCILQQLGEEAICPREWEETRGRELFRRFSGAREKPRTEDWRS